MMTSWPTPPHALHTKVRYRPYYRDPAWPTPEHPAPWRIVGRGALQLIEARDRLDYVIQPWELTGTWMADRPLVVDAQQVIPWMEDEPQIDQAAHEEQEDALPLQRGEPHDPA